MRRLPYSDDEIADAFGSIAALVKSFPTIHYSGAPVRRVLVTRPGQTIEENPDLHYFSRCFGDAIEVEFGYADDSGSRGWVAHEILRRALRTDLLDVMAPDYQHRVGDLYELFHIIYNPASARVRGVQECFRPSVDPRTGRAQSAADPL